MTSTEVKGQCPGCDGIFSLQADGSLPVHTMARSPYINPCKGSRGLFKRTDYSRTFSNLSFTTYHNLSERELAAAIWALEVEIGENLVYDHFQPKIAGPLQQAVHFLQTRKR